MKTKTIKQSVVFKANAIAVFQALIDPKKHAKFTGQDAHIDAKIGGDFSAGDAYLTGKILELTPNEKIVLSLRHEEDHWPEDHYSKATFQFTKTEDGTRLDFTQSGVPEEYYEQISQGWYDYYWEPMKAMLEKA